MTRLRLRPAGCSFVAVCLPAVGSTVKPLYGAQQGAEIGYNPHKPGRPSHVYHSYFMANARLCLGVDVLPGKQHGSGHSQTGLWRCLDALPRTSWPAYVRAGCGYGQEHLMSACEERLLPYLFKLRFTKGVKDLVRRMHHKGSVWQPDGHGWEVMESTLRLSGWSRERRVIIVREQAASAPIDENPAHQVRPAKRRGKDRDIFPEADGPAWKSAAPWSGKIAVLVTSLDAIEYPATCMARQYRDRGDAEPERSADRLPQAARRASAASQNNYDELKNQWGWNGYCQQQQKEKRLAVSLRSAPPKNPPPAASWPTSLR